MYHAKNMNKKVTLAMLSSMPENIREGLRMSVLLNFKCEGNLLLS